MGLEAGSKTGRSCPGSFFHEIKICLDYASDTRVGELCPCPDWDPAITPRFTVGDSFEFNLHKRCGTRQGQYIYSPSYLRSAPWRGFPLPSCSRTPRNYCGGFNGLGFIVSTIQLRAAPCRSDSPTAGMSRQGEITKSRGIHRSTVIPSTPVPW